MAEPSGGSESAPLEAARRDAPRPPPSEAPASEGAAGDAPAALPPEFRDAFLAGAALFDARAYFEAHEVWEGLWRSAARDPGGSLRARRLKALIQLAAALLKHREGRARPAASLMARACRRLEEGPDRVLGVSGRALAAAARRHLAGAAPAPRIVLRTACGTGERRR